MDSSSAKSTLIRFAICSGLHAHTHARSLRCGLLFPVHRGGFGPLTAVPSGRWTCPDNRSCTYACSRELVRSFAVFGRRAAWSAFHCATDAPVVELSAARGSVAAQLARDRRRISADRSCNFPDALVLGFQQGNVFAFREGQKAARGLLPDVERRHAASLAEPSLPDRL